jgi:Arc/MetJ-type ribon-helix-helix transcriptional regulator
VRTAAAPPSSIPPARRSIRRDRATQAAPASVVSRDTIRHSVSRIARTFENESLRIAVPGPCGSQPRGTHVAATSRTESLCRWWGLSEVGGYEDADLGGTDGSNRSLTAVDLQPADDANPSLREPLTKGVLWDKYPWPARLPGMVIGMATRKVTVTLDERQLDQIRALVESGTAGSVSGFVQHAVGIVLDDVAGWGALLAEALRQTGGSLTEEERIWADSILGPPKPRACSSA